jgi:hypothetical protein
MSGRWFGISRIRVVIGAVGGLLAAFGVLRLATEIPGSGLLGLVIWLAAALVIHDAVLSPGLVGVGILLRRIPARARTYVQGALVAGGLVTVVALPMLYRAGSQPPAEALLEQDLGRNLALLLAVIAVAAVVAYLSRIARVRSTTGPAGDERPALGGGGARAE